MDGCHVVGARTWAVQVGGALVVMDPGEDCGSLAPAEAVDSPDTTPGRLRTLVGELGIPVSHLVLSHGHPDHAHNLPAFLELRRRHPAFAFTFCASWASPFVPDAVAAGAPVVTVDDETALDVPGGPIVLVPTPGHSPRGDDVAVWLPTQGALFAGDLPQPQGPTYEQCTFVTPFSNHADGETALASLDRLAGLPFITLLMGHDGVSFDRDGGLNALAVTSRVLRRERTLAQRLIRENPGQDRDTYVEWIHDTIAHERGVPNETSEERKWTSFRGPCPYRSRESFYRLFDVPSIESFVDRVLASRRP